MIVRVYEKIRSLAPDEATIMLLLPIALFSDCGNDGCTQFDDRPRINAAQEYYAGLLEKYLKVVNGEEKGKLIFPQASVRTLKN